MVADECVEPVNTERKIKSPADRSLEKDGDLPFISADSTSYSFGAEARSLLYAFRAYGSR